MGHLQRLPSFDQDPVLSSDPCAHHDGCRGRQPKGAGAGDGQDGDGSLEGEADDDLRFGDVLVVTLPGGESEKAKNLSSETARGPFVAV